MGADRWCYPIPMALQRHTGSHNDVPALKPVPGVPLAPGAKKILPDAEKKSGQIEGPQAAAPCQSEPCQAEDGTRD
jgi:hypothetical protein